MSDPFGIDPLQHMEHKEQGVSTGPARRGRGPGRGTASVVMAAVLVAALVFTTIGGALGWYLTREPAPRTDPTLETRATDSNTGTPTAKPSDDERFSLAELATLPSQDGKKARKTYEIAADVGPAVVAITTEVVTTLFGRLTTAQSAGSGIIFTKDGYILTNSHVIEDAKLITIVTEDGDSFEAKLVGADKKTDLAVLKVEADKDLPYAVFGDSDQLVRGELAVAIGNPLGELAGTVTVGVISALNRQITIDNVTMNLIQTDAAINAGNSGGALVNSYGEVVGINSAKKAASGVEGLGFAIPINDAKPVIEQLINDGYVTGRPVIGISGESVPEQIGTRYGWPLGVYVGVVQPGSAAETAGIREGDIIVAFGGVEVTTVSDINRLKDAYRAGDRVEVKIFRTEDKSEQTMTLTLGEETPEVTRTAAGALTPAANEDWI